MEFYCFCTAKVPYMPEEELLYSVNIKANSLDEAVSIFIEKHGFSFDIPGRSAIVHFVNK